MAPQMPRPMDSSLPSLISGDYRTANCDLSLYIRISYLSYQSSFLAPVLGWSSAVSTPIIMRSKSAFRERSLAFAKLHKEVRAMTERVHARAIKRSNGDEDYIARVSVLIEALIDRADARGRVICFASATEFGLSLRHQLERCRQAAMQTGSDSIMVLYWAAVRRMHGQGSRASNKAEANNLSPGSRIAETAAVVDDCLRAGICRLCEDLDVNSRCANGHNALTPISGKHISSVGEGLLSEAQVYQCVECKVVWTRYKHRSDPFAMWFIKHKQ